MTAIKITGPTSISPSSSIVLDGLRLGSALLVLFHHAYSQWFPTNLVTSQELTSAGHTAVVIFFVISGYVIAYTTINKNRSLTQYAQARVSRLSSMVIPALLITAIAEFIVKSYGYGLHEEYSRGNSIPRYILSGFFLNEIWFFSAAPPMNGPLWSLSYEFWYYAIFGLFLYIRKNPKLSLLAFIACLIAGPKILLMMPIWLAGCLAYVLPKPPLKKSMLWLFVVLCLVSAAFMSLYTTPFPYQLGKAPFYYSNQFLTDWGLGFLIALSIWFLPVGTGNNIQSTFITNFRKIADLTFPIYVLHYPLLILYKALSNYRMYDTMQMLQACSVVLVSTVLLGLLLDSQRFLWTRFFSRLFQFRTMFSKINLSFSGKFFKT